MSKSTYALAAAALMALGSVSPALGHEGKSALLRAQLSGFNEVISSVGGAVFSDGSGRFRGRIAANQQSIGYQLTYQVVETVATADTQYVNQAHLHFGQRHTTGGIIAWLCDSADNPSPVASTPTCPVRAALSRGPSRPLMSWRWLARVSWPVTSRLWWRRSGPGPFTPTFTRMPSGLENCAAKSTIGVTTD